MLKIAASILKSKNRLSSIEKLNETNVDYIHIDVMDNKFVNNYQFPIDEIKKLSKNSNKLFDVHLMVKHPENYIKQLGKNSIVDSITIHIEIDDDINKLIKMIKSYGTEVGLAINSNTDPKVLNNYYKKVDKILVMSVEPGYGGQSFIDTTPEKITKIRNKCPDILIEVDGGINEQSINKIKYISDIIVAGSYITDSQDYQEAINNLKK